MRRTRATYHYKIRKLKKDREKLQKEAMAKAISENISRQLWTEVRKIRNKNILSTVGILGILEKMGARRIKLSITINYVHIHIYRVILI